jgi:Rrf2 family protein
MLKMNLKTEYAIQGMLYMAKQPYGKVITSDEIIEALKVPPQSFLLVLKNLRKHGLIMSSRGTGGGFFLTKPLSQISLLQVIEAAQGKIVANYCLEEGFHCENKSSCRVHPVWRQVQKQVESILVNITIEDLTK